jgi:hypothetical protein
MTQRTDWSAHWLDESMNSFDVKAKDGTLKSFKKGTWVILPGRDDKVIIDSIVAPFHNNNNNYKNKELNVGPRGITYLPWRYDEKRFATMSYTMRGNSRFIICYPAGMIHFGLHIDWDRIEITSPPDNIDNALVEDVLEGFEL